MTHKPFFLLLLLLLGAPAFLLSACAEPPSTYEIDQIRENPAPRPAAATKATTRQRFGDPTAAPEAPSGGSIDFDLPSGWSKTPGSGERLAGFELDGHPAVKGTIVQLAGTGGGLLDNVNRWRDQLGLEPVGAEEIAQLERLEVLGLEAVFIAERGTYTGMGGGEPLENAMLAGVILALPRVSLFVKVVGPADVLEPRMEEFRALATSLRFGAGGASNGSNNPATPQRPQFTFEKPETWVDNPKGGHRIVNLHPEGHANAECYVAIAGGPLADNINRWRRQMGQPPLPANEIDDLPRVAVLDGDGVLITAKGNFTGMDGSTVEDQALLGVIVFRGQNSVFVKMTGPAVVVDAERERFLEFCASLKENT